MLIDPRDILNTIKTLLEELKLPPSFGEDVPAFQVVKLYDLEDLGKALEELLVFKDRVAIILLENATHENEISGRVLTIKRTVELTILIADRNWSNRQKALMGEDSTPGAIQLAHLVVNGVAGETSGLIVEPNIGEIFSLQDKRRDNAPGRIAWRQELSIPAGILKRDLSRTAK